jgi:HEPN domain-containing protein
MPPDRQVPGSAADWLARAKGDLAIARAPLPEGAFYEDLCFHTQQAAEKAIKSVYQYKGWTFRYTHDLDELIDGLKKQGLSIPPEVIEADVLTEFGWDARYPGTGEPVTQEEYIDALHHAENVISWVEKIMGKSKDCQRKN